MIFYIHFKKHKLILSYVFLFIQINMGLISNNLPSFKTQSYKYEESNVVVQFRFVDVTLLIKDIDGKTVKDAQVKAFS